MGTLFELTYIVELNEQGMSKEFFDELRARNGNLSISMGSVPATEML